MFQAAQNTFYEAVDVARFERFRSVRRESYGERHTLFACADLISDVNVEQFHVFNALLARGADNVLYFAARYLFVRDEREISLHLGELRKRLELKRNGKRRLKRIVIEFENENFTFEVEFRAGFVSNLTETTYFLSAENYLRRNARVEIGLFRSHAEVEFNPEIILDNFERAFHGEEIFSVAENG